MSQGTGPWGDTFSFVGVVNFFSFVSLVTIYVADWLPHGTRGVQGWYLAERRQAPRLTPTPSAASVPDRHTVCRGRSVNDDMGSRSRIGSIDSDAND